MDIQLFKQFLACVSNIDTYYKPKYVDRKILPQAIWYIDQELKKLFPNFIVDLAMHTTGLHKPDFTYDYLKDFFKIWTAK